jgi:hypothetical protein
MKINIKQCCHSPTQQYRFDAEIGDRVLIRRDDGSYVEAVIQDIPSPSNVTVMLIQGEQITIPVAEIAVLMLGN